MGAIMRKEYGKALRELFTVEMNARLPQFLPIKVSSIYLFPGERAFRWIPAEPIHLWILLCPHQKGREAFTVEIGWSRLGRFPELSMRPSLEVPSARRVEFAMDEYVCRLGMLVSGGDYWWQLEDSELPDSQETYRAYLQSKTIPVTPQDAIQVVRPQVQDAVDKLRLYAIPYLEELHSSP